MHIHSLKWIEFNSILSRSFFFGHSSSEKYLKKVAPFMKALQTCFTVNKYFLERKELKCSKQIYLHKVKKKTTDFQINNKLNIINKLGNI